jgi:hypothetical protein
VPARKSLQFLETFAQRFGIGNLAPIGNGC